MKKALTAISLCFAPVVLAAAPLEFSEKESVHAEFAIEGSGDELSELPFEEMLSQAVEVVVEPPQEPQGLAVITDCFSNGGTWSCTSYIIADAECEQFGIDWPVVMLDIGHIQTCTGMA